MYYDLEGIRFAERMKKRKSNVYTRSLSKDRNIHWSINSYLLEQWARSLKQREQTSFLERMRKGIASTRHVTSGNTVAVNGYYVRFFLWKEQPTQNCKCRLFDSKDQARICHNKYILSIASTLRTLRTRTIQIKYTMFGKISRNPERDRDRDGIKKMSCFEQRA